MCEKDGAGEKGEEDSYGIKTGYPKPQMLKGVRKRGDKKTDLLEFTGWKFKLPRKKTIVQTITRGYPLKSTANDMKNLGLKTKKEKFITEKDQR